MQFVALRYFNAAGATERHGEQHEPESHLIPNVIYAALGKRPHVSVFGQDYPTPDGTCVRDYIHVADLASAHLLALDHLRAGGECEAINLGNGKGYTVLETIEAVRKVSGREIPVRREGRRAGDPARLVASAERAHRVLGWQPRYPELDDIVRSAWEWHLTHPDGYGK
jgi:UDP-glucose 4-epimerase